MAAPHLPHCNEPLRQLGYDIITGTFNLTYPREAILATQPGFTFFKYHHSFKFTMSETVRSAFAGRERPLLSYGIAFPAAAARHVTETFNASRVYVICSGSLSRNTDSLDQLKAALGQEKVVGCRIGMQSHTLWSEVLEIVKEARDAQADLILTLGAGSLTDGAKIIALVSFYISERKKSQGFL